MESKAVPTAEPPQLTEHKHMIDVDLSIFESKLRERKKTHRNITKIARGRGRLRALFELKKTKKAEELYEVIYRALETYSGNSNSEKIKEVNEAIEVFQRLCNTLEPKLPLYEEDDLRDHLAHCEECRDMLLSKRPNSPTAFEPAKTEPNADLEKMVAEIQEYVKEISHPIPRFDIEQLANLTVGGQQLPQSDAVKE